MATRGNLSDKEGALVDLARRELAQRAAPPGSAAVPVQEPATVASVPTASVPASPPPGTPVAADHAARIAALFAVEREQTQRQRDRIRRWGIYIPLSVFAVALLWLAILLLRRPWG